MAEIKDFLGQFKKFLDKDFLEKELILKVIYKVINIEIKKEDIKVKNNILILKSNPYLKSEISLNKEKILKEFKKEGIETLIKDIK